MTALPTVGPPPTAHTDLKAWLEGVPCLADLQFARDARLVSLLNGLPPPGQRDPLPLRPLDSATLRNFHLPPAKPPPPAAPVPDAPSPMPTLPPADLLRLQIWELTHRVHDYYTNEWPPTWPRPPGARDPRHPDPSEWYDYAIRLLKAGKELKATLERWCQTSETPPLTREALITLTKKLGELASGEKVRQKADRQVQVRQEAAKAQELDRRETELLEQKAHQRAQLKIKQLQDEHQRLSQSKRPEDMAAAFSALRQITDVQVQLQGEVAKIRGSAAAAAGSGAPGGKAKKQRRE